MIRVVVTGLGVVTPVGTGHKELWQSLMEGRHGFRPVQSFDTSAFPVHVGAEVLDFDASTWLRRLSSESVGRTSSMAIAAARLAIEDADLLIPSFASSRIGVSMGTTSGEPGEIESFNDALLTGNSGDAKGGLFSRYPSHLIPGFVAAELELRGPNMMLPAACAAGNYAVSYALDVLRAGRADVMLAGGADAFSRITYAGFSRLRAIAPEVCQPFDNNRKGMIPGEGAAVLVLERLSGAQERGAHIYAEVAGYGLSCDAHHMTAAHPEGEGSARAMTSALRNTGIKPQNVSYISAHGTGTATNDRLETAATKTVFGESAHKIPMSSIKSNLGHTMGAASAIEAAVCALVIDHNKVPPTLNFEEPDPACDLDYVTEGPRELKIDVVMSNAYAFGGNNSSLIMTKPGLEPSA